MSSMKSLNKVLDILEVFLDMGNTEIRLSDLAQMTGINKATVYHIVSVLTARGYMGQVERRGKYVLGPKFLNYSAVIKQKNRIKDITLPHLIRLNKQIEEAVSLFYFDGQKIIFIDEVYSKYPSKIPQDAAAFTPLYSSAVGKIALANRADQELEDYLNSHDIQPITANTITDPDQLRNHIRQVARDGVAYDNEERYPGITAVAVSIRNNTDKLVACICVLGAASRLSMEKLQKITPDIKNCAMQISAEMD